MPPTDPSEDQWHVTDTEEGDSDDEEWPTEEEEEESLQAPPGLLDAINGSVSDFGTWEPIEVVNAVIENDETDEDKRRLVIEELDKWGNEEKNDDELVIAEVYEINTIDSGRKIVKVAIDSAAAESVCPRDWATCFPVKPCGEGEEQSFTNANRGPIKHYGEKRVALKTGEKGWERFIGMPFQACDVKRPLAAVRRICEKGNIVQFGPAEEDSFI